MSEISRSPEGVGELASPRIKVQNQWWVLVALAIMVIAIQSHQRWFLNFVHVFAAILWTGTDIFMGFMLGPILRRLDFPARRAVISRLMPRMLFYMPTVTTITTTSGWFLADQLGYMSLPFPERWWLVAGVVIVVIMTVQGLGILLPTNLRVYLEINKDQPDGTKIQRWMQTYVLVVALQGLMQLAMIVVMARFATGL